MGNTQGAEQGGKCGYRVLGVQPNSPASKVGLVSFFDFIVEADGEIMSPLLLDVDLVMCLASRKLSPLFWMHQQCGAAQH